MKPFSKLVLIICVVSISLPSVVFAQTNGRTIIIPNDNQRGVFRYHTPFRHITYRYGEGISDNRVATVNRYYDFRQAVAPDRLSAAKYIIGQNVGGQFVSNVLPGLIGLPGASSQAGSQSTPQAASRPPLDLSEVDSLLSGIAADRQYRSSAMASLDGSKQELQDLMKAFAVEDPTLERQSGNSNGPNQTPTTDLQKGVNQTPVSGIQN